MSGFALFLGHMALTGWYAAKGAPEIKGLSFTLFLAGLTYLLVDNLGVFMTNRAGPFQISLDNLSTSLVIIVMCFLLLRRLWKDWRMKEELEGEFEAAREMQESLVQRMPETPAFAIEAAYSPANHVGGDFYRIIPAPDGAILVVAGDVSGKGLKAAMTVSVLVGAMESVETRVPGLFLAKLNRATRAHLQSGFVTCCCVRISSAGELTVANAGHLAPYLGGHEVTVESGLPLGLVAEAEYAETRLPWPPEAQLTLLSDGVVEAANAQDELFGFDRTRAISAQPAAEIAEAARAWGQNDDITVVTVRRTHS